MQNNSLKNKKIIISAGASGIGLAITKTCLDRGATVLATDINNKFINKLKKNSKYKKKLFLYNFDASDENDVSNFFKSIKSKFKRSVWLGFPDTVKYLSMAQAITGSPK